MCTIAHILTVHCQCYLLYRDGSLDIRVGSGDLSRLSSNADALSSTGFQDIRKEANKQEPLGDAPCYQTGVLRTNCIDCLDRTNVAQYAYGLAALGRQLHAMGLTHVPKIHPDSSIASALMEMYQSMGDALAHQYGGSAAHNMVSKYSKPHVKLSIFVSHLLCS